MASIWATLLHPEPSPRSAFETGAPRSVCHYGAEVLQLLRMPSTEATKKQGWHLFSASLGLSPVSGAITGALPERT